MTIFSTKKRQAHLGPYPLEKLVRVSQSEDADNTKPPKTIVFENNNPKSIINAMGEYQAMMDAIRHGSVNPKKGQCPTDLKERTNHIKGFGYFGDASMVAVCKLTKNDRLINPTKNPDVKRLGTELKTKQTKTLAAGIDLIMADLKESVEAKPASIQKHTHAIILLYEFFRDPKKDEAGKTWILNAQKHRAALRATETATVIANYVRLLGYDAKAHSITETDVNLNSLAVRSGLATKKPDNTGISNPFIGDRFGLAVVTTTFKMKEDKPIAQPEEQKRIVNGWKWKIGWNTKKSKYWRDPYKKRNYVDGAYPFEKIKRVEETTTYIDEAAIPRVPKRTDMFARSQFGDLGKKVQEAATGGHYVQKAAPGAAQRRVLGAFVLLQDGEVSEQKHKPENPKQNAEDIKAACYFLGVDAVGLSRCPEWTWYSHDARGEQKIPPHHNAVSIIIDQGYETMEGGSGDDWIAVAQSMRAYLRFSLLGGVVAKHIRNLGYEAKAHSVLDGDVLQPPLLLLSGLGEVSRIGEVILNPCLGPRLKSGIVTTTMPVEYDKPIDFGLQKFCEACQKCARECPSGAITAGPKKMFNGYEIWKSDSQKCTTYRLTTQGGAMCGRCMKTCPWNLEGIFAEKPFRWLAMNMPVAAPALAKLDDMLGRGGINNVKKWWWDIEKNQQGKYAKPKNPVNRRGLQKDLKIKHEEQTLAVYPANLAPHPHPYPFPMDREKGIRAYKNMITADEYKQKKKNKKNKKNPCGHVYASTEKSPVIAMVVSEVVRKTDSINEYILKNINNKPLPKWEAGAHIDIVVAPEFLRSYSLTGNPDDTSCYKIAVQMEEDGKGGSKLLHRIFVQGRKVFGAEPVNEFALNANAKKSALFGGGIGITPLIPMAHELHKTNAQFELMYSIKSRKDAAYINEINNAKWKNKTQMFVSDENSRMNVEKIIKEMDVETNLYVCGPDRYMDAIINTAKKQGWDESNIHFEYFLVPDDSHLPNEPFVLRLAKKGVDVVVNKKQSATDRLEEEGIIIDVKCSDGLCGTCKCGLISGEVEHRDYVLSNEERKNQIILCRSRAAKKDGVIEIDL